MFRSDFARPVVLFAATLFLGTVACGGGSGKADGGTGGSGAGTGGASAAGGAGGGGGGDAAGGSTGVGGAPVTMWPPATCSDPVNGVSTAAFCEYFGQACGWQFGTGAKYASAADCMAKYADLTANADPASTPAQNQKGCVAYHLCVAGKSNPVDQNHCIHAAGGGGNPCAVP